MNYFDGVNNKVELRKRYLEIMKEYHPDLTNDEEEKKKRHENILNIYFLN